jgi:hypothetical protein
MRVCLHNGKLVESQSNDGASLETLWKNAIAGGRVIMLDPVGDERPQAPNFMFTGEGIMKNGIKHAESGIEIKVVSESDFQDLITQARPADTWQKKRQKSFVKGGYGTWQEQMEIIGEQGIDAFQAHIAKIKSDHPKV